MIDSKLRAKRYDAISHVHSHLSPDSSRVGRSMSLYYTPNVHRSHPSHDDSDVNPPRDVSTNTRPQLRPLTAREDRPRQRQLETSLNDDTDAASIFIFPQPPNSTSPVPSSSYSSPRSPYSEDSLISRPAQRHRNTRTSQLSPVSQPGSFTDVSLDIDGISTPSTIITLSLGSSPRSAFTDVGEDEESVDDGRIEAILWDWDDDAESGDGPGGEFRRSQRSARPNEMIQSSSVRRSQVRPYPLQHGSGEHLRVLIERERLRNRWREETARFRHTQKSTPRSYSPLSTPSNAEVDLLSLAPHPKIRIPFLDFFASILGVDESTVDLLTQCSTVETHGSILFPGHAVQPLLAPTSLFTTVEEDDDLTAPTDQKIDKRVAVHGFHKALLSPGIERDSWGSLKEGLTVFYNTAASVPAQNPGRLLGLVQLWGLVSHVCTRGGKVIKGVYSASPTFSGIEEAK